MDQLFQNTDGLRDILDTVQKLPEGSGGGDDVAAAIVDRTVAEFSSPKANKIGDYALRSCTNLTSVDAPNAKSVGQYAFQGCSLLASANLPLAESIDQYAFNQCNKLMGIELPSVETVYANSFRDCQYIETIYLPNVASIPATTFYGCRGLKALVLGSETLVPLANTSAFTTCYRILGTKNAGFNPNGKKIGFIYVQLALIEDYKEATNWADESLVTQLRPIVKTATDLASIDGAAYDRAWVDAELCVYIYNGTTWVKEA